MATENTYTERMGKVKCASCGWTAEIVATAKDGKQTIICANCDLDKTPEYSKKSNAK